MNLQELLNRTRDYVAGRSYRGPTLSDGDIVVELNHGLRALGSRLKMYDPSVTLTLTSGVGIYNVQDTAVVSKIVLEPHSVTVNGNMLWDSHGRARSVQSLQELEEYRPGWRTLDSGTPDIAVWYGSHSLLLSASPTATVASSGNCYISGQVYPGARPASGGYYPTGFESTDLTSVPDLDYGLHDCLCYMASQYLLYPVSTDQVIWARIQAYNSEWVGIAESIRRVNERAVSPFGINTLGYGTVYYGR